MMLDQDTIVAVATPPGRGGIGVVRLSGERARSIAEPMLRLRHPLTAGRVRFAEILDGDGEVLDEAVVTWFQAPHTYTSEDVVEIACHGSPVLLDHVLRGCVANGARLAEAGEFTQRAFLAGRIDLTQAEAVEDLVRSSTLEQARQAARQLGGSLSRTVAPIKGALVELIATLEAGIDFAEDDIDLLPQAEISARLAEIETPLITFLGTFSYGRVLRDGFTLAIVGRPNAGKSSLFNRLLERDRAIVTAAPGTTRDSIAERMSLDGIPLELVDTAGLRDAPAGAEGEAEMQGIARSRSLMAEADVVLLVLDASAYAQGEALHPEDAQSIAELESRSPILVSNKMDLVADGRIAIPGLIATSALTGAGIEDVRRAIVGRFVVPVGETGMVTNIRQHTVLRNALEGIRSASVAVMDRVPHEMVLLDLYGVLRALDRLTGVTTSEDVLALIFSTFCIGK